MKDKEVGRFVMVDLPPELIDIILEGAVIGEEEVTIVVTHLFVVNGELIKGVPLIHVMVHRYLSSAYWGKILFQHLAILIPFLATKTRPLLSFNYCIDLPVTDDEFTQFHIPIMLQSSASLMLIFIYTNEEFGIIYLRHVAKSVHTRIFS